MQKHNELIKLIEDRLKGLGLKVYRIDKELIPDIVVSESEIIPIEAQTNGVYSKISYIKNRTKFPITFVVTKPKMSNRWLAYDLAKELREQNFDYKTIQKTIIEKFNLKISFSTLSDWLTSETKPKGYFEKLAKIEVKEN